MPGRPLGVSARRGEQASTRQSGDNPRVWRSWPVVGRDDAVGKLVDQRLGEGHLDLREGLPGQDHGESHVWQTTSSTAAW